MKRFIPSACGKLSLALCALSTVPLMAAPVPAPAGAVLKPAQWLAPKPEEVKSQALGWLASKNPGADVQTKAAALWSDVTDKTGGIELLRRTVDTLALADADAQRLALLCAKPRAQLVLPSQQWLTDPKTPTLVAANMRLWYGLWLIQGLYFDEAAEQLSGLKPGDVVAPAELLFYQSVACHRLLKKDEGLKAIAQLLDGAEHSPRRYVTLARLMEADLSALQDDTLDHIARRMEDIERRLDLGRAGPKVREVEDGVIKSLDKMIKKIEEQQKQQQQQQQSGGQMQPSSPAQQSTPMQGKGPGDVAKKNIGSKSGWGDLPPKEREEAIQGIGRDFPPHYREIIEQYFRRLASEEETEDK